MTEVQSYRNGTHSCSASLLLTHLCLAMVTELAWQIRILTRRSRPYQAWDLMIAQRTATAVIPLTSLKGPPPAPALAQPHQRYMGKAYGLGD